MPTLDWIGKAAVVNHHREVPTRLLHCDSKLSFGDPEAGNLLVQGDNLEALKALLPYYAGKVKCIYIDPPYNTGSENWAYNDNVNSPEIRSWLKKTVGPEGEDLSRHDKWLCMMYPRLSLLREFLRNDGIIFISIDDNEFHLLRVLCDEIFGRRNFVAAAVWRKAYVANMTAKHISNTHDYIVMYAKSEDDLRLGRFDRSEEQVAKFKNPDGDKRGAWKAENLSSGKFYAAGQFEITTPAGRSVSPPPGRYWRMNRERYDEWVSEGRIYFGKNGGGRPMLKKYADEVRQGLTPDTWWGHENFGSNKEATTELKKIFGGEARFETPKPLRLIEAILRLSTDPDSIILDSFAGSATTAHAVSTLNRKDGGNRQFILVEMDKSIAAEVSAERLRRAGVPGFRFCTIGDPLFDEWGGVTEVVSYSDLAAFVFFSDTGNPIPAKATGATSLLGTFQGRAVHLLFAPGSVGVPVENAGNVLTLAELEALPPHDGPRVVYAEGCTVPAERLALASVVFKQVPYQLQAT